jgi:hypothetical protein
MEEHRKGSGKKRCTAIANAIAKYGWANMRVEVLRGGVQAVGGACREEELDALEVYWIKELATLSPDGYNLVEGGAGFKGPAWETRERMSTTHARLWEDVDWKRERLQKLEDGRRLADEERKMGIRAPSRTRKLRRPKADVSQNCIDARRVNVKATQEGEAREKATRSKLRKAEERWQQQTVGMQPAAAAAFLKRKFADRERHQARYQARKAAHQG